VEKKVTFQLVEEVPATARVPGSTKLKTGQLSSALKGHKLFTRFSSMVAMGKT
jgi:hypothetical protein